MRTVVVTGTAGSLGQRVLSALQAHPLAEHVISVDCQSVPTPVSVERHVLDLSAPGAAEELAALAKSADSIIHLAWVAPDAEKLGDSQESNLVMFRAVLDAASAIEPATFVYVSSATVYGAWPDNPVPLTEDAPLRPNPELAYAVQKAEAENVLSGWSDEHPDVRISVLRPAVTLGTRQNPFYEALAARNGPSGRADGLVQYVHIDDLAEAVVHAWAQNLDGTFNVAPDDGISSATVGELAGGFARVSLPRRLVRPVATLGWKLFKVGRPAEVHAFAEHDWVLEGSELRKTGWQPQYTSEQAFVVSDEKAHWDDLPPVRRQGLVLSIASFILLVLSASLSGGFVWLRRSGKLAQGKFWRR